MSVSSGIRTGQAYVELTLKDNKFLKGLRASQAKLRAWGSAVTGIGTRIAALGASLVTPLLAATKMFSDMGSDLVDLSQRTGTSVEALSGLGYAAEQSGADIAALEAGLRKMQQTLADAMAGSETAKESLRRLGLTTEDLKGKSPDEQLKLLGDRLSRVPDPAKRTALAMDILGKSGTKLLPMFAEGAAGIDKLVQEAKELGLIISTEDARAAEEFGDQLSTLWKVVKVGVFQIGAALAPVLSEIVRYITEAASFTAKWIRENRELVLIIAAVASGVTASGVALIGLGGALTIVSMAIDGVLSAIGMIGSALIAILSPIGLTAAALISSVAAWVYFTDSGRAAAGSVLASLQKLYGEASSVIGLIVNLLMSGELGLAGEVAMIGLRLAWEAGMLSLSQGWFSVRNAALKVFDAIVTEGRVSSAYLGGLWESVAAQVVGQHQGLFNALRKGWELYLTASIKVAEFFSGLWDPMIAKMKEVLAHFGIMVDTAAKLDPSALLDDLKGEFLNQTLSITGVDARAAMRHAAEVAAEERAKAEGEAGFADAARGAEATIDRFGREDVIAALRDDLAAIEMTLPERVAKAAEMAAAGAAGIGPAIDIGNQIKGTNLEGTFSSFAASRMGTSPEVKTMQDILKEQRQHAKLLRDIAKAIEAEGPAGLMFSER